MLFLFSPPRLSRLFKANLSNTTVWLAWTILTSLVACPVTVASFDVSMGPWGHGKWDEI